jgi:MFS family permease
MPTVGQPNSAFDSFIKPITVRAVVDLGLAIAAVCFLFISHNEDKEQLSRAFIFDIYEIKPYNEMKQVTAYFSSSTLFVGKTACFNATHPSGCDLMYADMLDDLRNEAACNVTSPAPMCSLCVDEYAKRVHDYAVGTASAIVATDTHIEKLRDQLEGCIARSGAPRTVTHWTQSNIFLHLTIYMSLSSALSLCVTMIGSENHKAAKAVAMFTLLATLILTIVALAIFADKFEYSWWFDCVLGILQIVFFGSMIWPITGMDTKRYEQNEIQAAKQEQQTTVLFGITMIAVAPSIAIIVSMLHGWAEWRMVYSMIGILATFFAFGLLDDIMLHFWPYFHKKNKGKDEKQKRHLASQHMHTVLVVVMLFIVFMLGTVNLPAAAKGDYLNGTIMFVSLLIFLTALSVGSLVMQEFLSTKSQTVANFKLFTECVFRIVLFIIIVRIFSRSE